MSEPEHSVDDEQAVLEANRGFYRAFERADLDAMSGLWEHSDRVRCTHPGWATLHGWADVVASWFAIFQNPSGQQVILTNEAVAIVGDVAWVTLDENLLHGANQATVAATNLFVRSTTGWLMVNHHGSPVVNAR